MAALLKGEKGLGPGERAVLAGVIFEILTYGVD